MDTNAPPLSIKERTARIRLIRTENVGPVTFRQLLSRFGSAQAALEALPELARRGGRRGPLRIAAPAVAEREIAAISALNGRHLFLGDADYPRALANIPDAPPVLSLLGHDGLPGKPAVGIVGARNASTNGRHFAEALARDLSDAGVVVVSGMARGIDAAAHRGALSGGTVAVLAGGADIVYPKENRDIYDAIRETGTILSEMPPGTEPTARHFPSRNRIISGLSLGVAVVEAAMRSGSLITARLAAEQGRDVFAVPGFPMDPRARGTNDLIRNGAALIEGADDILDILNAGNGAAMLREPPAREYGDTNLAAPAEADLEAARQRILDCLGYTAVAVDAVIRDSGIAAATVWTILLELEIAGRLERLPGMRVALVNP